MNNENQIGDDEILKKNQIPHNKLADLTFHEFSAYLRDLIVKSKISNLIVIFKICMLFINSNLPRIKRN